jgi:phosphoribosylglycinamide formyltransferase 1
MSDAPARLVVLISGRGSNLQAIIDHARTGAPSIEICTVISDNPEAPGLKRAEQAGIPTDIVDHHSFKNREEFENVLMKRIDTCRPRLVALAGFMRVLSPDFVTHYRGHLLNIHPSLLPQFPGLNTHERALKNRVEHHGASVHFVTPEVDAGPIIIQAMVPVFPDDTPEGLAARVLKEEHRIYPQAIRWFVEGRLSTWEGKVLLDGKIRPEQGLVAATPSNRPHDVKSV